MRGLLESLFHRGPSPPKVGLALSGGGARGLAHIGVLKVFERERIPIHFLAGTSAGGLIAAAYAAGLSPFDLEQEALRMSRPRQLVGLLNRGLPIRGLLSIRKVVEYLTPWLGETTFSQLRIPLAVVAVDLNRAEKVVLCQGSVLEAVLATIALPGLFPPIGRDGRLLVDGGLLDNLPADVVRQMGADIVIAVDVSTDERAVSFFTEELQHRRLVPEGLVEMVNVLWRSVSVMMHHINCHNLEQARPELIIRPPIPPGVTVVTGLTRAPEVIAAGESATQEQLPRLRNLLAKE